MCVPTLTLLNVCGGPFMAVPYALPSSHGDAASMELATGT